MPGPTSRRDGGFVKAHLLSGGGSGRWQFWSAALDQWDAHRVLGDGAGTYESWWAQHASFSYFVRDAHSLYLEALGELGILGFLLIVAVVVIAGVAVGVRRSWRAPGDAGVTTAALTAVFAAYGFSLGFEWMWELTAVSVLGVATLALWSPGPQPLRSPSRESPSPHRPWPGLPGQASGSGSRRWRSPGC